MLELLKLQLTLCVAIVPLLFAVSNIDTYHGMSIRKYVLKYTRVVKLALLALSSTILSLIANAQSLQNVAYILLSILIVNIMFTMDTIQRFFRVSTKVSEARQVFLTGLVDDVCSIRNSEAKYENRQYFLKHIVSIMGEVLYYRDSTLLYLSNMHSIYAIPIKNKVLVGIRLWVLILLFVYCKALSLFGIEIKVNLQFSVGRSNRSRNTISMMKPGSDLLLRVAVQIASILFKYKKQPSVATRVNDALRTLVASFSVAQQGGDNYLWGQLQEMFRVVLSESYSRQYPIKIRAQNLLLKLLRGSNDCT